jgi:hypothetical protein
MGGAATFYIGMRHLDLFSQLATFSAGSPPGEMERMTAPLLEKPDVLNKQLKLLWIGCGRSDSLFPRNEAFAKKLDELKIKHTFHPTDGFHNWLGHVARVPPRDSAATLSLSAPDNCADSFRRLPTSCRRAIVGHPETSFEENSAQRRSASPGTLRAKPPNNPPHAALFVLAGRDRRAVTTIGNPPDGVTVTPRRATRMRSVAKRASTRGSIAASTIFIS